MNRLLRACAVTDLADGEMRAVENGMKPLAICRAGGEWFAFRNNCTHRNFPLTEGFLEGTEVECPLHGARFCVRTGALKALPAPRGIQVFPVRIEGEVVLIELGASDPE
jgi:nitrite reductase/ring-hydroxylating ferredoxin subunit